MVLLTIFVSLKDTVTGAALGAHAGLLGGAWGFTAAACAAEHRLQLCPLQKAAPA